MSKTEDKPTEVLESVEVDSNESPDAMAEVPEKPKKAHSTGWISVSFSLIACIAVVTVSWFGWNEVQRLNTALQSVEQSVLELEPRLAQIKDLQIKTQNVDAAVERLTADIGRADSRNQSVIDRVEMVAEQLAKAQVDTRSSYVLAEAEYLLKLADQRLLIERNPETAVNLMRTAQALLGQLQDGRLLSVRERLAQDLQTLSAVQPIDILGIQAELLALDSVLDDLELPVRRLLPEANSEAQMDVEKWLGELSQFIRIREVDAPITPLVSASDAGRAREVLRLSLEQIKVALIREDQTLFDAGLEQAKRLTAHFFNTSEGAGLKVVTVLSGLEGTQITREIPDAAQGLRALKTYRDALTQERVSSSEVKQ